MAMQAKQATVPFSGKRLRKPESGMKVDFKEMEQEFRFGTFPTRKNKTTFSDVPLHPVIFR